MKKLLIVCFALIFLLFGCTAEEEKVEIYTEPKPIVTPSCGGDEPIENVLVVDLESPPTLQIVTYHDERYEVTYNACMWEYDGMVLCADAPHPLQIQQISPLFNAEGVNYSLRLKIEPYVEDYTVVCWDRETEEVVPHVLDYENDRIDLDPRLTKNCVFEVIVEYPQGTASYCFGVEFIVSNSAVIDETEEAK